MIYKEIPNEVVRGYSGKPLKDTKKDENGEALCKPFKCSACEEKFTSITSFRDHFSAEHPDADANAQLSIFPELEEQTAAKIILSFLTRLQAAGQNEALAGIRKPNDGLFATSVSRKAFLADQENRPVLKFNDKEYDWLRAVLNRKLPLSKEAKDNGGEQQTVAMHMYGLNDWTVIQALTILSERDMEKSE